MDSQTLDDFKAKLLNHFGKLLAKRNVNSTHEIDAHNRVRFQQRLKTNLHFQWLILSMNFYKNVTN